MPLSRLYRLATRSLPSANRVALARLWRWLRGRRGIRRGWHSDGLSLCRNICSEAHLTGATGPFSQINLLANFLAALADGDALCLPADDQGRENNHRVCCTHYADQGLAIDGTHLPSQLYHYTTNMDYALDLVGTVKGATARQRVVQGRQSLADALAEVSRYWDRSKYGAAMSLSFTPAVWATYDSPSPSTPAPRDDAFSMSICLALPLWSRAVRMEGFLLELSYAHSSISHPRFPTVADAGMIHLFRPAPDEAPDPARPGTLCGWTRSLAAGLADQPELIHDNAPLTILNAAPRFVGRIPP